MPKTTVTIVFDSSLPNPLRLDTSNAIPYLVLLSILIEFAAQIGAMEFLTQHLPLENCDLIERMGSHLKEAFNDYVIALRNDEHHRTH